MDTGIYKENLSKIAEVYSGHPFRGSIEVDNKDGDAFVVQVRDTEYTGQIIQNRIIKTVLKNKKKPNWLVNGDILFVAKGAKHYSVIVDDLPSNTVCSPHFFLVRIKKSYINKVLPEFICWQLNQQPAKRYFKANSEGSNYLSVRKQNLEGVHLKIFPIEQQRRLVALHRCGVKEQKTLQKLIKNRQQQLEAIAIHALESAN